MTVQVTPEDSTQPAEPKAKEEPAENKNSFTFIVPENNNPFAKKTPDETV